MKILTVITIYNPDINLLKQNLDAFRNSVSETILWDNTPGGSRIKIDGLKVYSTGKNMGLPYAYNFAYHYAKEHGFTHLMTMDQDSVWVGFDRYIQQIKEKNEIAVYTVSTQFYPKNILQEVYDGINSGSIIPLQILDETGGFYEDFFVDAVDEYFHYAAREKGFKIYGIQGICYLRQKYGAPTKVSLCGLKSFTVSNYSPMRLYGITRNHIILWKTFKLPLQKRRYIVKYYFIRMFFNIIIGEKNKYLKIKALLMGIYDGLLHRKSRINLFMS